MMEAIRQHGLPRRIGYRLRRAFPWIDIRSEGTARGVIAIGPRAVGIFAFGGLAVGVVASGGLAVGLVSAGGLAVGLLFVWAGWGIGAIASAGLAMGLVATGGLAIGLVAEGGLAIGLVAKGGLAVGRWVPQAGVGVSHYTSQNVPPFLISLEPYLRNPFFNPRYLAIILPAYLLFVFGVGYLQYRERKRVHAGDDWLLGGD